MTNSIKRFFLSFSMRGHDKPTIFEVTEKIQDELEIEMERLCRGESRTFYSFSTIDGQSVAMNFKFVQAIRFLWEPAFIERSEDKYDGLVRIWLDGAKAPIEASTTEPVPLYDFYTSVGYGPEVEACPSFLDEDGELIAINAKELVYLVAPTAVIEEGSKIVLAEAIAEDETSALKSRLMLPKKVRKTAPGKAP